jgi:hypothetical protein
VGTCDARTSKRPRNASSGEPQARQLVDRQTDWQTGRQLVDRQTDRQIDMWRLPKAEGLHGAVKGLWTVPVPRVALCLPADVFQRSSKGDNMEVNSLCCQHSRRCQPRCLPAPAPTRPAVLPAQGRGVPGVPAGGRPGGAAQQQRGGGGGAGAPAPAALQRGLRRPDQPAPGGLCQYVPTLRTKCSGGLLAGG